MAAGGNRLGRILDFFGVGPVRARVRHSRTAALQKGVADVVKLSESIQNKMEKNPALDLAKAMHRQRKGSRRRSTSQH